MQTAASYVGVAYEGRRALEGWILEEGWILACYVCQGGGGERCVILDKFNPKLPSGVGSGLQNKSNYLFYFYFF